MAVVKRDVPGTRKSLFNISVNVIVILKANICFAIYNTDLLLCENDRNKGTLSTMFLCFIKLPKGHANEIKKCPQ